MTKNIKMQITNGDAQMWGAIVDDLYLWLKKTNDYLIFKIYIDLWWQCPGVGERWLTPSGSSLQLTVSWYQCHRDHLIMLIIMILIIIIITSHMTTIKIPRMRSRPPSQSDWVNWTEPTQENQGGVSKRLVFIEHGRIFKTFFAAHMWRERCPGLWCTEGDKLKICWGMKAIK